MQVSFGYNKVEYYKYCEALSNTSRILFSFNLILSVCSINSVVCAFAPAIFSYYKLISDFIYKLKCLFAKSVQSR